MRWETSVGWCGFVVPFFFGAIVVFFKELKISTFDATLAATLGFLPAVLHYGLMTLVSFTVVTAFDSTGPVLVVAFFVIPSITAYLLTDRLGWFLGWSALVAVVGAFLGTAVAFLLETMLDRLLLIHLRNHEGTPEESVESDVRHLHEHFQWSPEATAKIIRRALSRNWALSESNHLRLTAAGREIAERDITAGPFVS